jgi:hypothetical protein
VRDLVSEMHEAQKYGVGGAYDVGAGVSNDLGDGSYRVAIDLVQYPSQTLSSDGAVVEDFPGEFVYRATIAVAWKHGQWVIEGASVKNMDQ